MYTKVSLSRVWSDDWERQEQFVSISRAGKTLMMNK